MPTASLFSYLLCLCAVYLFRVVYHGWFGVYFFLVLITAPLLILLLSLPSVISLKLHTECSRYCRKGESREGRLIFRTVWKIPAGRVGVRVEMKNRFTGESTANDHLYDHITDVRCAIPLPAKRCGRVDLRVVRWECSDLLSFFSFRKKNPKAAFYTVLPLASAPDPAPDLDAALSREVHYKPKPGGGFAEEHELREYRPGDPSNSIHWKLSAKTDRLIVREALEALEDQIFLVLADPGEDDRGLSVLAWLSSELCRRELPHQIVSGMVFQVNAEEDLPLILSELLAEPFQPPCPFDEARARCIFFIRGGEVSVR